MLTRLSRGPRVSADLKILERLSRRPLFCAAVLCLIGAAAGSALNVPALYWGVGAAASGAIVWWKRGMALFAALMLLFAMEAAYLTQRPMPAAREGAILTGEVCLEPLADSERTVLTLSNAALDGEALNWNMRVYAYEPVSAGLGDRVEMTVETWLPEGRRNPYGFDFDAWCRRNGVACASMQKGTAAVMPGAPSPRTFLRAVRARIGEAIDGAFSDQAPLARALVLGDRSDLDEDVSDDFRGAGIAHILSVSGLHVTCLALALDYLLRRLLSRRAVFFAMAPLLVFYAALVGFSGPIVRAVAMYLAFRFAPMTGRPGDGLTSLSASALGMLAINPLTVGDAGFILSFSAMAGLILLGRPLERLLKVSSAPRWARPFLTAFTASVAASVAILPAQVNLFGAAQPYGPLVNMLAVPMTTFAMPLMFLAVPVQLLFPAVGPAAAWPSALLLKWTTELAAFASGLPHATVPLGHVPWGLCAVWGIGLYLLSDHAGLRVRWKPALLTVLPAVLIVSVALHAFAAPRGLAVDFLSVGEADAAVVRAEGQVYLVDAGENGTAAQYLAQTGCSLRAMFLTHPHDDHIGGAGEVRALYPDATVYVPECWARVEGVQAAEARAGLEGPFVTLAAGDEVKLSETVAAKVLYPPKGLNPADPNAASLVLMIENGDGSALLTGDLSDASLLNDIPDVDILKAAHHGADIKGAELLLRAATPGVVAVSVGRNSNNHPSPAFVSRAQRLRQAIFRTDECGMVRASILPGGAVAVTPFLALSKEASW
jgi:competence protein ComEC